MVAAGFSPSVRLFEAAARGVPIISDFWPGLDTFFELGREILVARSSADLMRLLNELPEERRRGIAAAARKRFLMSHTPQQRAKQLEEYCLEVVEAKSSSMKVKAIA
jgi:spore maturation protein CgeB